SRQAGDKNEKIKKLNARIRELEEMEDVTMDVESEEETRLKEAVAQLEEEKRNLTEEMKDAWNFVELRNRQFQAALARINSQGSQLERTREALEAKERQYGELLRHVSGLTNEVAGLRGEGGRRARAEASRDRVAEENALLRNRIEELNGNTRKAREEIKRLEGELEFARGDEAVAAGELGEKKAELAKANQALEAKKAELRQANLDLNAFRNDQRAKEAVIDHLQRRESYLAERVE